MNKKELRILVRDRMKKLSDESRKQKSLMLTFILAMNPAVREAKTIALFSPLGDEPQIGDLISVLARDHEVVLPRVEGDNMNFYPYSPEAMQEGAYGIMEPVGDSPVAHDKIDVIIVPGVAFSDSGARMGRGKGYYDRYMSQRGFKARKIGVCYTEQMVKAVPCEPHDISVDEVVCR